mgnify:CR=1 FL=1
MRVTDAGCVRVTASDGRTLRARNGLRGLRSAPHERPRNRRRLQTTGKPTLQRRKPQARPSLQRYRRPTKPPHSRRQDLQSAVASGEACDDPTPSYEPGRIDVRSRMSTATEMPEVVITEGGTYCYGNTGQGYWLSPSSPTGSWKLLANGSPHSQFVATKGPTAGPISASAVPVLLPGRALERQEYKLQRWEYEGKNTCKPPR